MGRSAILLALAGLALGLWLGFNPTTHRELSRWWTRTAASQASEKPAAAVSLRQLDRSLAQWFRKEARPSSSAPAESNPVPSRRDISTTLQAFWRALGQIWAQLLVKLGIRTASG